MHLKREQSPKNWPIERKGTTYLVRPRSSIEQGVPISIIFRDMLKFAKTRREVKKAINAKQIMLNNKVIFDERRNAVLFDIITIIPPKDSGINEKHYKITMGKNKKFGLEEIDGKEAGHKIAKVINKKTLKGNKMQVNLSDGRNFISNIKCKVNDSVKINLKSKKLEDCLPLKKDAKVIVFAGKHAGENGVVKEVDEENNRVRLESEGKLVNILIKQLMVRE